MKTTTFPLALLVVLIHTSSIAQTLAYEACNICGADGFKPVDGDETSPYSGATCAEDYEKGLAGEYSPAHCINFMYMISLNYCGGCKLLTPADICLESTAVIMEAVDSSYNDKDATWQAVTGVERTISDDFTTNQAYNKIYESACDTAGGTYKELTYEAKCHSTEIDEITLHVIGQPRCYAKSCAAAIESDGSFSNKLLQQFTLKPTAERASEKHDSTSTWTCTGALNDGPTNTNIGTTACAVATNLLNTQTVSLISATIDKKPAVSDIKLLFLIPTKGKKVQYKGEESTTLEYECGKVSGFFTEKDFKMTCTSEGIGASEATFEVTNFPLCLASVCKTDQAAIDGAIDIQFKDEMLDSEHLDETQDWTCIGSGAVMAASIKVSVGTVIALWWYLT